MARGGITQLEVQKARETLIARGIRPSIDSIRIELGNTGSKSTIQRHLKALEDGETRRLDDEALLSEGLRATVAGLARQLREEAGAVVAEAEARHRAERDDLQARISHLDAALTQAIAEREGLEASLASERATHDETRESLNRERIRAESLVTENAAFAQRLDEHASHLASLEDKHRQARDALEHYRQLAKEQRDQEHRRHEAQVQQLQVELRRREETLTAKQEELTRIARDNARLAAELADAERRDRDLRQTHGETRIRLEQLLADRGRLEAERDAQATAFASALEEQALVRERLAHVTAELTEKTVLASRLAGCIEILERRQPPPPAEETAEDAVMPPTDEPSTGWV